jgi:hypothetical protein
MKQLCSICGKEIEGYSRNAKPVNDGVCCKKCDDTIVLPRRIQDIKNRRN